MQNNNKENIGAILKKAREGKKLSLESVHEATKIPLDALHAIEEGYIIKTLSPFYLKGFIKIYAKFMEIDVTASIELSPKFEQKIPSPRQNKTQSKTTVKSSIIKKQQIRIISNERKIQLILISAVIVVLILMIKFTSFILRKVDSISKKGSVAKNEQVKKETVKKTPVKVEPKTVLKEGTKENIKKTEEATTTKVVESKEIKSVPTASVENETKTETKEPMPSVQELMKKKVVLTVRATKKSWLMVKADEKVVFKATLKMGAVETWTADKQIEISGNNIGDLEFELNGKMIGTLGRKHSGAKSIIVTSSGFTSK